MKNFKDFELTTTQQLNTIGKGQPAWADGDRPDFADAPGGVGKDLRGKPDFADGDRPDFAGAPEGVGKPE
ncbi:MAG: hypothetical protein AB8G86_22230 [Saprospiraceae bacterium]